MPILKEIIESIRFMIVFSNPYPLPPDDISDQLIAQGYRKPDSVARVIVVAPDERDGIATRYVKNGIEVVYAEEIGMIGNSADTYDNARKGFEDIHSIISEIGGENITPESFEVSYSSRVRTDVHPLASISPLSPDFVSKISSKVGRKMMTYGYGLCSYDGDPPSKPLYEIENWLTLKVIPLEPNPNYYQIRIIGRRKTAEELIKLYDAFPNLVNELIIGK